MHCRKGGESTFEPGLWPASPSLMDKLHQPLGNFSNCTTEGLSTGPKFLIGFNLLRSINCHFQFCIIYKFIKQIRCEELDVLKAVGIFDGMVGKSLEQLTDCVRLLMDRLLFSTLFPAMSIKTEHYTHSLECILGQIVYIEDNCGN